MELTTRSIGTGNVISLTGRLDAATAPAAEKYIRERLQAGSLVLDFSQVQYVSSAGLRVVLATAKELRAAGKKLALAGLTDEVMKVFKLSGFTSFLTICNTVAEAEGAI